MRISDWSSDVCSSDLFKVALLDRADIAVHDDKLRLMPRDGRRKNFHLSGAEQGGRARAAHAHDFGPDDVEGDGGGQTNRLLQPRFAGTPSTRSKIGNHDERPCPACNARIISAGDRRSDERRVGKEGVSTGRSRWSQDT